MSFDEELQVCGTGTVILKSKEECHKLFIVKTKSLLSFQLWWPVKNIFRGAANLHIFRGATKCNIVSLHKNALYLEQPKVNKIKLFYLAQKAIKLLLSMF